YRRTGIPLQQSQEHERRGSLRSGSFTNRWKAAHLCGGDWQGGRNGVLIRCERRGEKSRLLRFWSTAVRVSRYRLAVLFDASLDDAVRHGDHLVYEARKVVEFRTATLCILGGRFGVCAHGFVLTNRTSRLPRRMPCCARKVNNATRENGFFQTR